MKRALLSLSIILGLATGTAAHAATSNVVINEIAWMGTGVSPNDEWIELYNPSDKDVSLTGWTLNSADGKIKAKLKGTIVAHGFYLLERTDDNSVPNIKADAIYTGALNNVGQNLILQDAKLNTVDQVAFKTKWPVGNNTTKQTMERIADGWPASNASRSDAGWQTSKDASGTPKAQNSILPILPNNQKTDTTYLSALSQTPIETSTPWILFIVALAIAIISVVTVLWVKYKILIK